MHVGEPTIARTCTLKNGCGLFGRQVHLVDKISVKKGPFGRQPTWSTGPFGRQDFSEKNPNPNPNPK